MFSNKKVKGIVLLSTIVIALIVCSWFLRFDRFGLSKIDWANAIRVDGINYLVVYGDNKENMIVEEEKVGDYIGEVKFTLYDKVSNANYKMRNYDATLLEKNTKLYLIVGEQHDIAAKTKDGYILYRAAISQ